MSRPSCHELREEFHSYRLGELSPLTRQRMEVHLEKCPTCRSELWLQKRLEDTAKAGTLPLPDAKKRELLSHIKQEISTQSTPILGSTFFQDFFKPRLVGPAAAALALVIYFAVPNQNPSPQSPAPVSTVATAPKAVTPSVKSVPANPPPVSKIPQRKAGWLKVGIGVRAYAKNDARIQATTIGNASIIQLDSGEVIASFKRKKGIAPLQITTPHAVTIIRGTSFSVSSSDAETRVIVRNGKVEVRANNGNTAMVHGGEMVLVTADGVNHSTAPNYHLKGITKYLGPQKGGSMHSQPMAVPQKSGRDLLKYARQTWRNGQPLKSLTLIEELLASESDQALLEEGLYLKATVYRDQGQRRAASDTLGLLVEKSNSSTGRLAQLERARILGNQLDQQDLAVLTLKDLLSDNQRDLIAEDAWYELCALFLENQDLVRTKQCLFEFKNEFPQSSHVERVTQILHQID